MEARLAAHLTTHASYFRGPPTGTPGVPLPFKEWLHFCVLAPNVRLLVNLSLMRDGGAAGSKSPLTGRVVALAETKDGWVGGVDQILGGDLSFVPGRVDSRFGETSLRSRGGSFELVLKPRGIPLSARLRLDPTTLPLVRTKTAIGDAMLNWLAAPRLLVSGSVTVNGVPYLLRNDPAYHDHNWGHWRWGRDLYWQWAFGLPASDADPWTVVFYRLLDRSRTTEHAHAVLLWHGSQLFRLFREHEVSVRETGFLRQERVLKIPPVMGLLAPQLTSDVSRTFVVRGSSGHDEVLLEIDNRSFAQLIVPNDTDLDATVINEVVGTFRLTGHVRGTSIESSGESFHEHVTRG